MYVLWCINKKKNQEITATYAFRMNTYVFIIKQLPIKHNDIIIANIATDSTETKIANWLRNLDPEITTQIHFRILRNVN